MSCYTRIIGQNDKIYRKFGDYCVSEIDNAIMIICSTCQNEYNEDLFWSHMQDIHNYPPKLFTKCLSTNNETKEVTTTCADDSSLEYNKPTKLRKLEHELNSSQYTTTEILENTELSDGDFVENGLHIDTSESSLENDRQEQEQKQKLDSSMQQTNDNFFHLDSNPEDSISLMRRSLLRQHNLIDIEKISSRHFENGKVLKRIFQQMRRTDIEFKYKINKLQQELKIVERELRKKNISRTNCMKIIPDKPFKTRDEVLILDEELHNSKEMRDCLHDEALLVMTENPDMYSRVIWRSIMIDDVAIQFCWRGVIDGNNVIKYPIKDLTMMSVFQEVFRERYQSQPNNYFKDRTMLYFNKAPERIKRSRMERKRPPKYNNEDMDDYTNRFSPANEENIFQINDSNQHEIEEDMTTDTDVMEGGAFDEMYY